MVFREAPVKTRRLPPRVPAHFAGGRLYAVLGALSHGKIKRHELLEFRESQLYELMHAGFDLRRSSALSPLALPVWLANEPVNSFPAPQAHVSVIARYDYDWLETALAMAQSTSPDSASFWPTRLGVLANTTRMNIRLLDFQSLV